MRDAKAEESCAQLMVPLCEWETMRKGHAGATQPWKDHQARRSPRRQVWQSPRRIQEHPQRQSTTGTC